MNKNKFIKCMLSLLLGLVCNVTWAQTFVEPETNGRYKLKGDNTAKPWLTNQLNGNSIVVSADESDAAIFEKTASGLKDVATGKYLGMNGSFVSLVDTETTVTIGEYYNDTQDGRKYSVKVSNNYMYNNNTDGKTHESSGWITNIERYWGFVEVIQYDESELESIAYTIDKTTGNLYKDGTGTGSTWNSAWKSTAEPQLVLSCTANNMQWSNNQIEIMVGQTGNCTYTLTAPEGYVITAYSFTFANNNHDTGNTLTMSGGSSYTTSLEEQTISAEPNYSDGVTSFSFTFNGTNGKGALLTNFTVTVSRPAPRDINEEREAALAVLDEYENKLGTAVGYYSYTIGGTKVGNAEVVRTALNTAETAEEVVAIGESLALNLPEVGRYYRLKGKTSGNYIDTVNCYSGDQMGMKAADACDFRGTIFLLEEGNRFKNVGTNTYVYGTRHIGKTNSSDANTWTFNEGSVVGCLTLTANGTSSHQLHDNTDRADRCGSICSNGTHNFIVEEIPTYTLTVNAPAVAGATGTWNGETKALPATWTLFSGETITNTTLTIISYSHTLTSFKDGETAISGNTIEISTLTANRTLTAVYTPNIFSATYGEKWVRLSNCSNKSYWATIETTETEVKGKTATLDYADEKQLWCLVGTAESFVLYNKAAGNAKALKVTADIYDNGSLATIESDLTATWKLKSQDFGYALVPTHNSNSSEWGINMYGGANGDLKLYGTGAGNKGSYWVVELADVNNPLTLNVEVDQVWESSPRVAELTFTINGKASQTRIFGSIEGQTLYLPAGATYEVSSMTYRGYTYNGCTDVEGVLTASYAANEERTLYYTPSATGKPYRIPAIATAPNGHIFAIADHRPCGNDIGYGEVDVKCRISTDNGATWSDEFFIADGDGGSTNRMETGYGDAAVVADRESNKLLVMMVTGRTVCHNGRWDTSKIGVADADAVNRVARIYLTYNETTGEWEKSEIVEMTDHIYSLFLNGETPTVTSMFIGSGKICQSRVVKKGDYYRLYCSMWTRDGGNRVIYSDDFGGSWNVLGTINDRPASGGDEPKVEELRDGTVVLSSRKYNGRYFNLFTFKNDGEYTNGSWGTVVASNDVANGLSFGGNSTNGEIYKVKAIHKASGRICDLMLQSIPTGGGRSDVAIYYKELDAAEYTTTTIAQNWTKGKHVSYKGSAYSTMISQADGRIAFLFEEEPGGYCIVYIPYTIEELTGDAYTLYTVNSTISGHGIGTFYASEAMQIPEGVKAYVATEKPSMNGTDAEGNATGVITMTELEGIIPANTGAVLRGEAKTYEFIPSISYGKPVEGNMMVGYEGAAEYEKVSLPTDGSTNYVLAVEGGKAGFYRKKDVFNVYNNKAYLNVPASVDAGARAIYFDFGGETGIMETENGDVKTENCYDLSGRRVVKAQKGVYIVNGELKVVK